MGKIVYGILTTVDGFIESPQKSLDWAVIDAEFHRFINARIQKSSALLFGRKMYENMLDYWPTAYKDPSNPDFIIEYSKIYNSKPKFVFSKTWDQVKGDATLIREHIPQEVAQLKEQFSGDLLLGGANIAAQFMHLGLIDELQLYIHPVLLGGGAPVFPQLQKPVRLQLAETQSLNSGIIFVRYLLVEG